MCFVLFDETTSWRAR